MSEQEWFKQADKCKRQFDNTNSEVQKALKSGKFGEMVSAVHKASDEIPELLRKLESLTPPKVEWQESWQYFIEALTGYLLFCRYYERGLLEHDESAINHAMRHL
jgi:MinD-like ATPase involved in chromosome partitioning or flagellar assembly